MSTALLSSVGDMRLVSGQLTPKSTAKVSCGDNASSFALAYGHQMDDTPKNHLRAWREFREMSQDDLATALGTAKGVISLLENGKRPLSDKWLYRLAEVLETRPGHILDVDPAELDNDIFDIWASIDRRDREQAVRILKTFRKTGTHDS